MSKKGVIILIVCLLGIPALVAGSLFATYVGVHNKSVRFEANVEKFHTETMNVLSGYTMRIKDMAQVPNMYKNDLMDVIQATFEGRYGENGSQAVFQFIQEQNLQLDSEMYKNIQASMEAGRNEFKVSQSRKLDICAGYEIYANQFFTSIVHGIAGFPKKDIDDMCTIITDAQTDRVFETKQAEVISLGG